MHFNVYLDDQIGTALNKAVKKSGKKRNALIREALAEWLHRHLQTEWPREVLEFQGIKEGIDFEKYREHVTKPKDDPFS